MKKTSRARRISAFAGLATGSLLIFALLGIAGCTWPRQPKSALARQRLLEGVRSSMVPVRFYFKRDIANEYSPQAEGDIQERWVRQMVEHKLSLDLGGIVLDQAGHVLITDPEIEPRLIDRIEVSGPGGRIYRARMLTLLKKMEGTILQVSDPAGLEPISFAPSKQLDKFLRDREKGAKPTKLPSLVLLSVYRSGKNWRVRMSSMASSFRHDSTQSGPEYLVGIGSGRTSGQLGGAETMGTTPSLVADREGNFVGVTIRGIVDLDQKHRIWKGQDVLASITGDLDMEEFYDFQKELQERYGQVYHEAKIYYRQPSDGEYGQPTGPERIVYGLAVDDSHLFVPLEMSRREAKQIESIRVRLNQDDQLSEKSADGLPVVTGSTGARGATCQGEFLGTYRDFAGFLVTVKDARFGKLLDLDSPGKISKIVPFHTIYARRRLGEKDLKLWYARCLREVKGYGDKVHLQPSSSVPNGSALVDLEGRLAGFYLRQRIPAEEQRVMELVGPQQSYRFGRSGSRLVRIFPLAEIAGALRKPDAALDPNIRAMSKAQAKRRMWLGLEYVPVNRELAKRVGLERLTKDGTVGLMVRSVYAGSPAEAIGVGLGDVLLQIKDKDRQYPTELRSSLASRDRGGYGYGRAGGTMVWQSRRNLLTEFLAAVGQGKKIELSFCSRRQGQGWQVFTKEVEVQQAPLDYDSAKKYRDRSIGLTVRDLTYEVRKALKMTEADPGVVVSKVEEGTPAAVAKIGQAELITRINSVEVSSVDDFKARITAARENKVDTVKIEIVRLGKTRVADLSLRE